MLAEAFTTAKISSSPGLATATLGYCTPLTVNTHLRPVTVPGPHSPPRAGAG